VITLSCTTVKCSRKLGIVYFSGVLAVDVFPLNQTHTQKSDSCYPHDYLTGETVNQNLSKGYSVFFEVSTMRLTEGDENKR
jgi:hypothetical protein